MRNWFSTSCVCLALLSLAGVARAEVKNVIVMICDGWGQSQIDATAYWNGYRPVYETAPGWTKIGMSNYMYHEGTESPPHGEPGFVGIHGYDPTLAWADWMYMQNYTTDSAAAATSMSCGEKTFLGAVGYAWNHLPMSHVFEFAESMSMSTGTVTSVPLSHATPAAFRAHHEDRNSYAAIAQEMFASGLDVIMGGGHPNYDDDGNWSPGNPAVPGDWKYVGGIEQWNDLVAGVDGWTLIDAKADFEALADGTLMLNRVAGVPQVAQTLQVRRSGLAPFNDPEPPYTVSLIPNVPTLATMATGALNVVGQNANGFALMIEGGAVDWAGHSRALGRLIEEQNDFDAAVQAVIDWVEIHSSWDETLLCVTGDHETGFLWGAGIDPGDSATWFAPVQDRGAGVMPGFYFYSAPNDDWQNPRRAADHTNQIIPFYVRGNGTDTLLGFADEIDAVWGALGGYDGRYVDNIELAQTLFQLLDSADPIVLTGFELGVSNGSVTIAWQTALESNHLGFNVLRAIAGTAELVRVNERMIRSSGRDGSGQVGPGDGGPGQAATYELVDRAVEPGATYEYRLESIDLTGESEIVALGSVTVVWSPLRVLSLGQNVPNPSNPTTQISFELSSAGHASLDILDVGGRLVRTLVDDTLPAEVHRVEWDGVDQQGRAVSSGVYMYRLQTGSATLTRKLTLLK